MIDFHQDTPSNLRIRTQIFPNDESHPVFIINTPAQGKKQVRNEVGNT
jgi:hypothetical protein